MKNLKILFQQEKPSAEQLVCQITYEVPECTLKQITPTESNEKLLSWRLNSDNFSDSFNGQKWPGKLCEMLRGTIDTPAPYYFARNSGMIVAVWYEYVYDTESDANYR